MAVESTYNWYWLLDQLREAGYRVKLVNPLGHGLGRPKIFWARRLTGRGHGIRSDEPRCLDTDECPLLIPAEKP